MRSNSRHLRLLSLVVLSIVAVGVTGCAQGGESTTAETTPTVPWSVEETVGAGGEKLYFPKYIANGSESATFKTSQGEIVVQLFGEEAPITVGNFIELAQKGFYEETKFHRYEEDFVVQGGDPDTKDASVEEVEKAAGTPKFGTGGPGHSIRGEFDPLDNPNTHTRGALGMARSQSPDSGGSQFYFVLQDAPFLDGQYTVFGQVTKGLEVVDKLRVGDTIESITISNSK